MRLLIPVFDEGDSANDWKEVAVPADVADDDLPAWLFEAHGANWAIEVPHGLDYDKARLRALVADQLPAVLLIKR